jgi:hypothetical protein
LSDPIIRKAADPKADMMFNDWQIIRFHLGSLFVQKNKIKRTGDLRAATWFMGDARSLADITQRQPAGFKPLRTKGRSWWA